MSDRALRAALRGLHGYPDRFLEHVRAECKRILDTRREALITAALDDSDTWPVWGRADVFNYDVVHAWKQPGHGGSSQAQYSRAVPLCRSVSMWNRPRVKDVVDRHLDGRPDRTPKCKRCLASLNRKDKE